MITKDKLRKKFLLLRKKKYFEVNPNIFNPLLIVHLLSIFLNLQDELSSMVNVLCVADDFDNWFNFKLVFL